MADKNDLTPPENTPQEPSPPPQGSESPTPDKPKQTPLSGSHPIVISLGVYIVVLTIICAVLLIQLLSSDIMGASLEISPVPTAEVTQEATALVPGAVATPEAGSSGAAESSAASVSATTSTVNQNYTLLFFSVTLNAEMRLLLLVIVSGALGGLIHSMRSYIYYVGNQDFVSSWIPFYTIRPFLGAGLAALFYLVVRAGFFTGNNLSSANAFGFFATAGMVGLFAEQALEKLRTVASSLFSNAPQANDQTTSSND